MATRKKQPAKASRATKAATAAPATSKQLAKRIQALQAKRERARGKIRQLEAELDQLDASMSKILQDVVACV